MRGEVHLSQVQPRAASGHPSASPSSPQSEPGPANPGLGWPILFSLFFFFFFFYFDN